MFWREGKLWESWFVFSGVADHLLKLGLQPKVRDSSFDFNLVYIAYVIYLFFMGRLFFISGVGRDADEVNVSTFPDIRIFEYECRKYYVGS